MSAPQRRSGIIALIVSVALLAAALLETGSAAAEAGAPSVRMVSGSAKVVLKRPPGRLAYLDLGVFAAAVGGSFEIWAGRPDYDTPIGLWEVVRSNGTVVAKHPLPETSKNPWNGLSRFFHVTVTDDAGRTVLDRYHAFCPGAGELARVSDEGPAVATYPQLCGGNPFTLGQVWGIDEGWASNAFGYGSSDGIKGPDGHYTATVSIAPGYRSLFGIPSADASVSVSVTLKTQKHGYCIPFCEGDMRTARGRRSHDAIASRRTSVPLMTDPDPSIRPDLVALPAWGITVDHRRKGRRDYLDFGATVWDEGPSPMVVEGFRRPDGMPIMDGWEYFYSNGVAVGRAPAGDLMWDGRPGHHHWHFEQFARYSLLAADQTQVVRSEKTGFCLAPTDAIDMTLPGAVWNPYQVGLETACGSRGSIWTREVLPTGWGDTYFQGLPGQSFDVTDLPNGTYYIAVQANPDGALLEVSTANNTELRRVILGGRPGHRTVTVPPWHGIDTEGGDSSTGSGDDRSAAA